MVGVLAGLIHHVEDSGVVVFEISKTDFFALQPNPVYLAYNPNKTSVTYAGVELSSGDSVLS